MKKTIALFLTAIMLAVFYVPCLAVAASASAGYSDVVADTVIEDKYKLGPGDELAANLIVGENAMTIENEMFVGPDGKIFFPKVGEISVVGLTIPEAKKIIDARIRKVYKEQYTFSFRLKQPRQVRIYLSGSEDKPLYIGEKKFVSVYGEVAKAGRFEFIPDKKFSDYISYAGGPTQRANMSSASLTRENRKYGVDASDVIFNGNSQKDMEIKPGDVINVPAQFFYFSDFGSFASMIFTMLALYNTFVK